MSRFESWRRDLDRAVVPGPVLKNGVCPDCGKDYYLDKEKTPKYCTAEDCVPTIKNRMVKHGFMLESTGGNCTAYIRNDGQIEEIVTLFGDPSAPENLTDRVTVGVGPAGVPEKETTDLYTLAEVLAALENPDDEYMLLHLRLYNGRHTSR